MDMCSPCYVPRASVWSWGFSHRTGPDCETRSLLHASQYHADEKGGRVGSVLSADDYKTFLSRAKER